MDSIEEYARQWAKREDVEVDTLSNWISSCRSEILKRINRLKDKVSNHVSSIFKDKDVSHNLKDLQDKYVIVPADKASNNIVFICKKYYIDCLIQELGITTNNSNPTYTLTSLSKDEILSNHTSVISSFGIPIDEDNIDLPLLYWIPKLHKNPFKERYIAGSATCSTKSLSKRLTIILSAIKTGLQTYCETAYSHSGINQMWILKNSKELLDNLQAQSLDRINSIQTFDFSTLYTTIPHSKLKQRISETVKNAFVSKSGKRRFTYLALNSSNAYFVKTNSSCKVKYTEDDIISMVNFLIDNIFVQFGGQIYQQTIGIPMGTNCAPLLADLFLYTYEAEFIQNLIQQGDKTTARAFNNTFRYIDDVLSLNNTKFENYLHHIYPPELEIKNTTVSSNSASYLDLFLEYDQDYRLTTRLYDKRDDFNFPIVNFPFLDSNIPSSPAYGVYISQLIRYSRACSNYHDFLRRTIILTNRLLVQGFIESKLKCSLRKFFGRHHDLTLPYNVSVSSMIRNVFGK